MNQPEAATQTFTDQRLRATAEGRYPGWETHDALNYFGLTYIELLAISDTDELRAAADGFLLPRDAEQLLPKNEASFWVALRSNDIETTHDQLHRRGLAVSPIVNGRRNNPQGNIIHWRVFTADGNIDGLVYPSVPQWGEDGTIWLARLRIQELDVPHPLDGTTLEQTVFEVVNPQAIHGRWQALLGFPPQGEQGLDVDGQWFTFREGPASQLTKLVFHVTDPVLKGQRFRVGNGVYHFI